MEYDSIYEKQAIPYQQTCWLNRFSRLFLFRRFTPASTTCTSRIHQYGNLMAHVNFGLNFVNNNNNSYDFVKFPHFCRSSLSFASNSNMDMTRERSCFTFDPSDMLFSLQVDVTFAREAGQCMHMREHPVSSHLR